jgi:hypothetical protein
MKRVHIPEADDVTHDPETFSCLMHTYERACADTKPSQIARQKRFFGLTAEQLDLQFQAPRLEPGADHRSLSKTVEIFLK